MKIYFLFRKSALFRFIWGVFLFPAAIIFRCLVLLYKLFIRPIEVNFPVIGIGNITVGGTGKTPFTIWLGRNLIDQGRSPVIFTTGYKEHQTHDDETFGDESFEIKENLQGVEVISGRNRKENLINYQGDNIAILDDSYQQWALKKTLEILLIDVTFPFGNGLTIPAGVLREPVSAINRADLIVLTHTDEISEKTLEKITQRLQFTVK